MTAGYHLADGPSVKAVSSEDYNSIFNKETGFHARWGKTPDDDPDMAPVPEIMDIEIADACSGIAGSPCRFCYKSNSKNGTRMSLETFKILFEKLPTHALTQIAFGIGDLDDDPDMWGIFEHTRANGVIPNVTINGWDLTPERASRLAEVMGAVAVSRYEPKGVCYDAVKLLSEAGLKQVNIHQLMAAETVESCLELLDDMQSGLVTGLNAVVFLMLKPKGRGASLSSPSRAQFNKVVQSALVRNLPIGFDSCSVPAFLTTVKGSPRLKQFEKQTDCCESGLFSLYMDTHGKVWPCSFGQDRHDLEPIDLLDPDITDFQKQVWLGPEMTRWRERLLGNQRKCPLYDLLE